MTMDPRKETPNWIEFRNSLRLEAASGNPQALSYLASIMEAAEVWDDLIDHDNPLSAETINSTMFSLMIGLPGNDFFLANRSYLLPVMLTAINAWMDATELERSPDRRLRQSAWWLKQMGVELYGAVAYLTGGFQHMRNVSRKARVILMHEDFEDFEKENKNA